MKILSFVLMASLLEAISGKACPELNLSGINLIKSFGVFEKNPTKKVHGVTTIGYGHVCKQSGCGEVPLHKPLSRIDGEILLKREIFTITTCLNEYINDSVRLNESQWAALTSWGYTIGCDKAKKSALINRLNKKENPNKVASEEMPKHFLINGKISQKLMARRKAEVNLFKTISLIQAHPNCGGIW